MWKWVALLLVVLFFNLQYRLWEGAGSIKDIIRLKQAIKLQTFEVEKLKARNQQLDAEVQALKAEPRALEERARSELGMVKQDETFCLVVEPMR